MCIHVCVYKYIYIYIYIYSSLGHCWTTSSGRRATPSGSASCAWTTGLGAKYYTPEITKMKIHWKMPWTIPLDNSSRSSKHPLDE